MYPSDAGLFRIGLGFIDHPNGGFCIIIGKIGQAFFFFFHVLFASLCGGEQS